MPGEQFREARSRVAAGLRIVFQKPPKRSKMESNSRPLSRLRRRNSLITKEFRRQVKRIGSEFLSTRSENVERNERSSAGARQRADAPRIHYFSSRGWTISTRARTSISVSG